MDKHRVYNLIILDESGSMESIKSATIKNSAIEAIPTIEEQFNLKIEVTKYLNKQ